MFHFVDKETETEIEGTRPVLTYTHLFLPPPLPMLLSFTAGKKSHWVAAGLQSRGGGAGLCIMRYAFDDAFDSCLYWWSAMGWELGGFPSQTAISGSGK